MPRPHRTKFFETQSSEVISAAPEKVRARIEASETWPEWQSEILATEQPDWAEAHQVVHGKARLLGFDVHGRSLTVASEETVLEQDVIVGVKMRVRFTVEPSGPAGSVVTHRLTADLPGGLAGTMLSALLARRLRRMQGDLLRRLKSQLEELP